MCKKKNIVRTYSSPYAPEQNGKVERFNRTPMDCVRATVRDTHIRLWGEAAKAVSHVSNKTDGGDDKSPHERRWGRKTSRKHLRVFGWRA